jgi:hypothetical protein
MKYDRGHDWPAKVQRDRPAVKSQTSAMTYSRWWLIRQENASFNFPTLAETYRVAALDIVGQRQKRLASNAA